MRNFVLGKRDNDDKSIDFRRQEAFATLPYEVTIRDVFNKAGFPKENDEPEIKKEIEDEIEQLTWDIIEDSAWKEEKMIQVMNAMPGVPTLYNGTEYAQTGFETPNKNVFVGNRGQIRHKSIEGNSYAAKKRGEFYNKVSADMSMSQLPGLSALRDGSTVSLNIDSNVWPIYKYDEKGSRVISIIDPNAKAFSENPKKAINLKTKNGACPIEEGTEFTRLIYDAKQGKYVDDKSVNSTYVVNKEGQLVNKENGQQVVLNDTVTTFYAKNPAYNKPSFMGSLYNQTK